MAENDTNSDSSNKASEKAVIAKTPINELPQMPSDILKIKNQADPSDMPQWVKDKIAKDKGQ